MKFEPFTEKSAHFVRPVGGLDLGNPFLTRTRDFYCERQSFHDFWSKKYPKRCVVGGCSNTANQEEGISVHEIPFWGEESPVLAKQRGKWEKFVKSTRHKWTATRGTVVCSKHFTLKTASNMAQTRLKSTRLQG